MNSQHHIWFSDNLNLQNCFCSYLKSEEGRQISSNKSYKKREFIYFNDDNADKLYFIHKGAVKIIGYTDDGQEVIKALLHKGEIFGESAVYGPSKRMDYAQAAEDCEICIISTDQVMSMMRESEGFGMYIHKLLGWRVMYSQKRMESLLFKDARARIAEFVIEQAKKSGRTTLDGAVVLKNYLTHQEIASFTGTSRQTVTTVLNKFREARILDFNRRRTTIRNINDLHSEVYAGGAKPVKRRNMA